MLKKNHYSMKKNASAAYIGDITGMKRDSGRHILRITHDGGSA